MYGEALLHFYMNFKVLENEIVSTEVRGVNLVLDAKILGKILNVPVEGFNTYVKYEWPKLGKNENAMYLAEQVHSEEGKVDC